jgi:hypothetical protein
MSRFGRVIRSRKPHYSRSDNCDTSHRNSPLEEQCLSAMQFYCVAIVGPPTGSIKQASAFASFAALARFYARHLGSIKDDSDTPRLLIGAELAAS